MSVKMKLSERTLIACLSGEIDEHSCGEIRGRMDDDIQRYSFDRMIFDFSKVTFMDSSGIGMIIGRFKILSARKKSCYILGAGAAVDKILNMTGIYGIIPKLSYEEWKEVAGSDR